jgi:hypothetical protein
MVRSLGTDWITSPSPSECPTSTIFGFPAGSRDSLGRHVLPKRDLWRQPGQPCEEILSMIPENQPGI